MKITLFPIALASVLVSGCFFDATAQPYVWSTIAGSTNSTATFRVPEGIAIGDSGELFVTDFNNHTVRKIAPAGADWIVSTIAGKPQQYGSANGTNSDIRFKYPAGVCLGNEGRLRME